MYLFSFQKKFVNKENNVFLYLVTRHKEEFKLQSRCRFSSGKFANKQLQVEMTGDD